MLTELITRHCVEHSMSRTSKQTYAKVNRKYKNIWDRENIGVITYMWDADKQRELTLFVSNIFRFANVLRFLNGLPLRKRRTHANRINE